MALAIGAGDRRQRQPGSGQVVTATGDGDAELSPSGCESSSTDRIRTVDVLVHRGTAPATATATATRPAGLERCVMFLLWEVGSCSNTVVQPGWQTEKAPGGFYYDPTSGWQWTASGRKTPADPRGGPTSRVRDHVRPRDPGGEQCRQFPHNR